MGDCKLKNRFPSIFVIAQDMDKSYVESGVGGDWSVRVCRNLQDWEVEDYCNLLKCLAGIRMGNQRDERLWTPYKSGTSSVKSFYNFLTNKGGGDEARIPYKQIWRFHVPPRVAFLLGKLFEKVF